MSQSTHCCESVVPLALGNVYFLSQKRPKSISNKGLSPYCNKKNRYTHHQQCITRAPTFWLCGLNVFRIGNQGKITFEWAALWSWTSPHLIHKDTDAPLVRTIETSRYHFFSFTIKKENWKSKRMNSFIMVSVSVVLVNVLLLKRNRKNNMMRGMRAK